MLAETQTHAAFKLAVYVGQDEAWDLHQRDDERSFSHRAEMITHQAHHRGQDGRQRKLRLVSVTRVEDNKSTQHTHTGVESVFCNSSSDSRAG